MSMRILNNPPLLLMCGNASNVAQQNPEMRALDENSMFWANRILNNRMHAYALEISIGNVELLVEQSTVIAVVGGDIPFLINGKTMLAGRTHKVKMGDIIKFKYFKKRLRTYLAVQGGFRFSLDDIKNDKKNLHALCDLRRGDVVSYVSNVCRKDSFSAFIADGQLPGISSPVVLRVVLNNKNNRSSGGGDVEKMFLHEKLLRQPYEVSLFSNSWEYRLQPKKNEARNLLGNVQRATQNITKSPAMFRAAKETISTNKAACKNDAELASFLQVFIFNEEIAVLLKNNERSTSSFSNFSSINGETKADAFLLPIDSCKLAQLPAGESVAFQVIDKLEAVHLQNNFLRFFQTHGMRKNLVMKIPEISEMAL